MSTNRIFHDISICSMYGMCGIFTNLGGHVCKYSIQGAYVYVYIYIHHMNIHRYIYIYIPMFHQFLDEIGNCTNHLEWSAIEIEIVRM